MIEQMSHLEMIVDLREQVRDLRQRLVMSTQTNRALQTLLQMDAHNLEVCVGLAGSCQNRFGTLESAFLPSAQMEAIEHMSGQAGTITTQSVKPVSDSVGLAISAVRRRAKSSTRSTRKRAKRVRTGEKSNPQSVWVTEAAVVAKRLDQKLRAIRSAKRSKKPTKK